MTRRPLFCALLLCCLLSGHDAAGFGAGPVSGAQQTGHASQSTEQPVLASAQTSSPSSTSLRSQTPFPQLGRELVAIVERDFYDGKRAKAWSAANKDYAGHITDVDTFARKTRAVLAELHASHTAYYRDNELPYAGLTSLFEAVVRPAGVWYDSIGVDLEHRSQGYFLRTVFAGGPADKAGLRRGDLLLSADNMPFAQGEDRQLEAALRLAASKKGALSGAGKGR
jgi:C-terminal processing protease CtpA/Prc